MAVVKKWHEKWWLVSALSVAVTSAYWLSSHGNNDGVREAPVTTDSIAAVLKEEIHGPLETAADRELQGVNTSRPKSEEFYFLPKTALNSVSAHIWTITGGLDNGFATAMGLSEEQARQIDNAIRSTLEKVSVLETQNSRLVTDEDGNQYFEITEYDGTSLQAALGTEIHDIVKDMRSDIISDTVARITEFGGFGKSAQEIAIEEMQQPGGAYLTGVKVQLKKNLPGIPGSRFTPRIDYIRQRYGGIYDKAGIPIPGETQETPLSR